MNLCMPRNLAVLPTLKLWPFERAFLEKTLKDPFSSLSDALIDFSHYFRIKVTFSEPVQVKSRRSRTKGETNEDGWTTIHYHSGWKKVTTHTFHRILDYHGGLIYTPVRKGRRGWEFPPLEKVVKWEAILIRSKPWR